MEFQRVKKFQRLTVALFFLVVLISLNACSNSKVYTVAGIMGDEGISGDGGSATTARLKQPKSIFVDNSGNIYIADGYKFDAVIRKVNASDGKINAVVGSRQNVTKEFYEGISADSVKLRGLDCIFVDKDGNIFYAEGGQYLETTLKKVNIKDNKIYTVAGGCKDCAELKVGMDGVSAKKINLGTGTSYGGNIQHFFIDKAGNIYFVTMYTIWKINASDDNLKHIAGVEFGYGGGALGDGVLATLSKMSPGAIFVDDSENIYISDSNYSIRKINASDGKINTVAGIIGSSSAGDKIDKTKVLATTKKLHFPKEVSVDKTGNIYIGDNSVIWKVNASDGKIKYLAGTKDEDVDGDSAEKIKLYNCMLFFTNEGNVYFSNEKKHIVRKIVFK